MKSTTGNWAALPGVPPLLSLLGLMMAWQVASQLAAIEGLPFAIQGVMVNQQAFTKTANIWRVGNNARGTNSNRIVLARRTEPG